MTTTLSHRLRQHYLLTTTQQHTIPPMMTTLPQRQRQNTIPLTADDWRKEKRDLMSARWLKRKQKGVKRTSLHISHVPYSVFHSLVLCSGRWRNGCHTLADNWRKERRDLAWGEAGKVRSVVAIRSDKLKNTCRQQLTLNRSAANPRHHPTIDGIFLGDLKSHPIKCGAVPSRIENEK